MAESRAFRNRIRKKYYKVVFQSREEKELQNKLRQNLSKSLKERNCELREEQISIMKNRFDRNYELILAKHELDFLLKYGYHAKLNEQNYDFVLLELQNNLLQKQQAYNEVNSSYQLIGDSIMKIESEIDTVSKNGRTFKEEIKAISKKIVRTKKNENQSKRK